MRISALLLISLVISGKLTSLNLRFFISKIGERVPVPKGVEINIYHVLSIVPADGVYSC